MLVPIGWLALLSLVASGAKPWWTSPELLEASNAAAQADPSPARCCFNDGDLISLRSGPNSFIGRCKDCVSPGAYPDMAVMHMADSKDASWPQWRVFNTCDGKIVLQADTGKFLGSSNNSAPSGTTNPSQVFVHVDDWHTSPWAKWECVDAGNGKIGLQADSGRYLASCNSCMPGASPNSVLVHATSVSEAYAQWTVVSSNPKAGKCTSTAPTPPPPTTTCTPSPSPPCPRRVRKAWTALTVNEKTLFQNALGQAMLRGFHHKFIEIHMDTDSGHEAHDCLFFLWHRRYLLAYENMLRSLGDEYRCITLPYWDVGTLSTKFATGACQYFPDCNPLLSDMGGLETGTDLGLGTYAVADKSFNAATCIRSQHPVTRNFCQSWTAYANKTCLRCIPRNKWAKALPPPDVYIENVYNQLFSSAPYDFTKVTKGVQYRYHNAIHGALSSTMGTFAAPGDPIFYIHHATVDALHSIYYKCVVPPNVDAKHSTVWPNPANWRPSSFSTSCSKGKRSDGTYIEYQPTDRMTMKLVGCNGGYVDVQDPSSILKPFFDAIGRQTYAEFNNIQDLGANNSYSYDFGTSSLGVLATQCDKYGRPTASTLLESTASATEGTSPYNVFEVYTSVTETVDPVDSREDQFVREMFLYCKSKNVPDDQIMERINWMQCVFHNECKQGVFDYTTEFQSSFGIQGPPYCYTTISRLANRTISIGVPGWEQVYSKHYTCQSTVT